MVLARIPLEIGASILLEMFFFVFFDGERERDRKGEFEFEARLN